MMISTDKIHGGPWGNPWGARGVSRGGPWGYSWGPVGLPLGARGVARGGPWGYPWGPVGLPVGARGRVLGRGLVSPPMLWALRFLLYVDISRHIQPKENQTKI